MDKQKRQNNETEDEPKEQPKKLKKIQKVPIPDPSLKRRKQIREIIKSQGNNKMKLQSQSKNKNAVKSQAKPHQPPELELSKDAMKKFVFNQVTSENGWKDQEFKNGRTHIYIAHMIEYQRLINRKEYFKDSESFQRLIYELQDRNISIHQ